ncbi:transposase [Clostridium sporogenes]|uniref:transposase n=1 Tax=Clostridium sporogenes TaxID=1509 RepID=UPI003F8E6548|nr:helix-turn-helix domain-containing protein [Clostridium botulinum]
MSKKYSFEIKLKAVNMYLKDGIGSTTIAKKLELSSNKRVLLWVKRYEELGETGLEERRGKAKGIDKGRPRKQPLTLEQENEKLRAEVEYLKKLLLIERL